MRDRQPLVFWTGFAIIVALLIASPLVLPPFWARFVTEILIWGLLAMSSDILIGYTGMVSFGHSAFFGLGMYGAAFVLLETKPPSLWAALAAGLLAAAAVAAFVAYFSTRLREIYFAITTLIFSQIFYIVIFTWTELTGGENGLTFSRPALAIPGLFSLRFTPMVLHWFVLAIVVLSYLLLRRVTQSPFGMVLQSIRVCSPGWRVCSTRCRTSSPHPISCSSSYRARSSSTTSSAASAPWSGRSSAPPSSCYCARASRVSSQSIT